MLLVKVLVAVPKTCITAESTALQGAVPSAGAGWVGTGRGVWEVCTLLGERGSRWQHKEVFFNVTFRGCLPPPPSPFFLN